MNSIEVISKWFGNKDLTDLYYPIKINKMIDEIYSEYNYKLDKNEILKLLSNTNSINLIYNLFQNPQGHRGKNRSHCLYAFSSEYIGIDQEYCIKNGLKIFLNRKGWKIKEEVNFIDLIAEKDNQSWLFEIKGKQTYEWTSYAFAQGLEQCFPINIDDNVFKIRKSIGFGKSRSQKGQIYNYLTNKHKHIVILIPGFSPTIVWKNSKATKINNQVYHKQINEIKRIFNNEGAQVKFGEYFKLLNKQFNIVKHYNQYSLGWSFNLIEFKGFYKNIDFALFDALTNENYNMTF